MTGRYPWAEAITPAKFKNQLERAGGSIAITLKSGDDAWVVKYRSGVVYLDGGRKVRLSRLVWTPVGYQEIESDETDPQKRAEEALALMDGRIALAELDAPRSHLALLNKRLIEESEAQEKAETHEFQTLDVLTEKVIASWLRELADASNGDEDLYEIADRIEGREYAQVDTHPKGGDGEAGSVHG